MQDTSDLTPGMHVLMRAFDDVPEHVFEVHTIEDDLVTGQTLTGPLAGEYCEPRLKVSNPASLIPLGQYDPLKAQQPLGLRLCGLLGLQCSCIFQFF